MYSYEKDQWSLDYKYVATEHVNVAGLTMELNFFISSVSDKINYAFEWRYAISIKHTVEFWK